MNRADILAALTKGGLVPASDGVEIYAYADGRLDNSGDAESEWLLVFRFEADELVGFSIEERLVAP